MMLVLIIVLQHHLERSYTTPISTDPRGSVNCVMLLFWIDDLLKVLVHMVDLLMLMFSVLFASTDTHSSDEVTVCHFVAYRVAESLPSQSDIRPNTKCW